MQNNENKQMTEQTCSVMPMLYVNVVG